MLFIFLIKKIAIQATKELKADSHDPKENAAWLVTFSWSILEFRFVNIKVYGSL